MLSAPRPCRVFLFDLDGTLIDSRSDIAHSLNLVLERLGMQTLPQPLIIEFVGRGMRKLIENSLREATGCEPESSSVQKALSMYTEEYGKHLLDHTRLYPHVKEALDRLPWAKLAVVSNKPESFCRRILESLRLADRFSIILGGDSTPYRKPEPGPLLKAMDFCRGTPQETVIVGDSAFDIEAGKAAGMITCGVTGGFRPREELQAAGCDLIIDSLIDLPDHFRDPGKN